VRRLGSADRVDEFYKLMRIIQIVRVHNNELGDIERPTDLHPDL
jgi:hypothetical protein